MSDLTAKLFRVASFGLGETYSGVGPMANYIAGKAEAQGFTEFRITNPGNVNPKYRWMKGPQIRKFVEYARAIGLLDKHFGVSKSHADKLKDRASFKPWLLEHAETYLEPMFRRGRPKCMPKHVPARVRSLAVELLDRAPHIVPSVEAVYSELKLPLSDEKKLQAFSYSLKVIAELSGSEFELKQQPVIRPRAKPSAKAVAKAKKARTKKSKAKKAKGKKAKKA